MNVNIVTTCIRNSLFDGRLSISPVTGTQNGDEDSPPFWSVELV